jgi:cytochrome c-type biogenesis protein CcmF
MNINIIGNFSLFIALLFSIFASIIGYIGALKSKTGFIESASRASIAAWLCCTASILTLGFGFLTDNYINHYIWQFSNRGMPTIYKFTAIWGGMNGSMLFWGWLLTTFAALLALYRHKYNSTVYSFALPVQMWAQIFFLGTTAFFTNPFEYIKADFIPPDGNGLNPLLQNPYMAIHPPMLYIGFTLFSVPFALCMGSLLGRLSGNEWLIASRKWSLYAWSVLSAGIILGGFWAYVELGWGGFWAWDPVENASFLPWLTGTALIHSVLIQERKGMLKAWNVFLVSSTYLLTIFGTFLTRSGIVQSVHAFASTHVGEVFLGYLAIMIVFVAIVMFLNRKSLVPQKQLESILSREAAFLLNNLIFLSICFATIWGVMFPVLSEAITGSKQTVSAPFFNKVNVPLFMLMLLLMGIGTLIAWRKASLSSIRKTFLAPFLFSSAVAAVLAWAGITSVWAVISYSLCFFVFLTLMTETYRGIRTQSASNPSKSIASSTVSLFQKHSRRYGGYLVHLGVLIMTISITASMAHKFEKEFTLERGESISVGRFTLTLDKIYENQNSNYQALLANVSVKRIKDGVLTSVLTPEIRYFLVKKETTSEVALQVGAREDLYLVLAGLSEDEKSASFKIYINPLQMWLWVGAVIMVGGGLLIASPLVQGRIHNN